MKLKKRLLMIVVAPLAAALSLALAKEVSEVQGLMQEIEVSEKLELSSQISDLIHNLQKERGYSAGFVSSSGARFAAELTRQRGDTDQALQSATEAVERFKSADVTGIDSYERRIAALGKMRTDVSNLAITTPKMAAYYTQTIGDLIKSVETVIKRVEEPAVIETARVFGALIVAKEQAGLERAMGAVGFGAGAFTPELLVRFATYAGGEEAIINEAATSSSAKVGFVVSSLVSSPEHKALMALRELAPRSVTTGDVGGVTGLAWFNASTEWINRIQAAEFELRAYLTETSETLIWETTLYVILQLVLTLGITLIAAFWAYRVAGTIERETMELSDELERISDGDLEERESAKLTTTEFEAVRELATVFRRNAEERNAAEAARNAHEKALDDVVKKLSNGLARLSEGDLGGVIKEPFAEAYERLREDYNRALHKLQGLIGDLSEGVESLDQNAGTVKTASSRLAVRTEDQARTLVESSQSARELNALVDESAESAGRTERFAEKTRVTAESGAEVVQKAVDAMTRIEQSSDQITQIVAVIEDIAKQTNLLSLNAGVEAARAGEAGRGFALVANEVRSLAQRVNEAAQEIKALMAKSGDDVASGVESVRETGVVFDDIVKGVKEIGGLISDISDASRRQANAVASLTESIETIDTTTQSNAAMAEEMTAAAAALFDQAHKVNTAVEVFDANPDGAGAPRAQARAA